MDTQSVITAEAWPIIASSLQSPSLIVAILAAVALVVSTSLLSFLRRRSPLPPGPSPWPILGNLPQLGLLPHRALAKLADRYGPIMTIWFGSTPKLIVSSPEVACEVMKTNDKLCSSRPVLKTVAIFSLDGQNIAFSPDNDHWRKMRRLATLHLLSAKKLQESLPVREEEIRGMLDAIAVDATAADDGIEVRRYLTRATLNNILRLTVGKRFCYSSIRGAADVSSKAILEDAMNIDWNERVAAITGGKRGGMCGDAEAAAAPATGSAAEKKEGEMLIALIEEGFALHACRWVELEGRGKGREGEEEGEDGLEGGRWVGEQKGLEGGKWVVEDEGLEGGRWGERGGAGGRDVGGGRGGVGEGKRRGVQLARLFQSTPSVR
ncbi:unnamed protein product [Closterium sp. Naga37s-1]|nr:unnamed protein product [Closterium sp. Naga37s-1]